MALFNEVLVFRLRPEERDEDEGAFDEPAASVAPAAALAVDDFFPSPRPLTTGAAAEEKDLSFDPFEECAVDEEDDEADECKPADDIVDAAADDDFFPIPLPV